MPLQVDERGVARGVVARGVEREPVPLGAAHVALRHQLGPRLREREVDVEEDGAQAHAASSSQRTISMCGSMESLPPDHATVCATVQPSARSRSRPSSPREPVEAVERVAPRVAELDRADDRRDRELPLAGKRLRVDHEPRLALRGERRSRRADPGGRAPARPGVGSELREVMERGVASRWSRRRCELVLDPELRLVGERAEAVAAASRAAAADSTQTSRARRPTERGTCPARSARAGARSARRRARAAARRRRRPSARAHRPPAPPRGAGTTTFSTAGVPSARTAGPRSRRHPVRIARRAVAASPAATSRDGRDARAQIRVGHRYAPACRFASDGSFARISRSRSRSSSARMTRLLVEAPARARRPTGRRSASGRRRACPASCSPTCAGARRRRRWFSIARARSSTLPVIPAGRRREARRAPSSTSAPRAPGCGRAPGSAGRSRS